MNTKILLVIVIVLGTGWWLAISNPTLASYEKYQDRLIQEGIQKLEASNKSSVLKQLVNSKNSLFFKSVLKSQTVSQDYYFATLFDTKILSIRMRVLGIGGKFFPLDDPEEVVKKFEEKVIAPK